MASRQSCQENNPGEYEKRNHMHSLRAQHIRVAVAFSRAVLRSFHVVEGITKTNGITFSYLITSLNSIPSRFGIQAFRDIYIIQIGRISSTVF